MNRDPAPLRPVVGGGAAQIAAATEALVGLATMCKERCPHERTILGGTKDHTAGVIAFSVLNRPQLVRQSDLPRSPDLQEEKLRRRPDPTGRGLIERPVNRRQALKGMGVLALAGPAIVACTDQSAAGVDAGAQGIGARLTGAAAPNRWRAAAGTGGTMIGGSGGMGSGGVTGAGGAVAGTGGAGGSGAPDFDAVATCVLTPTDPAGEGPFFIHNSEVMTDIDLFRNDMRDGQAGVELDLYLRVLDTSMGCNMPIKGVEVYVWHTNATGFYSGFNGQNPNLSYTGAAERMPENDDRFCRGAQVTNSDGVVSFRTVFPGWYNGRAIHIHFVALRPGSGAGTASYRGSQYMVFTTQMYFDETFSRSIHEHYDPYTTRASGTAYNMYVKPETAVRPTVRMNGNVVVGALNVLTSSTGSRR